MKKSVFILTCALGLIVGMLIGVLATVGHDSSEITGLAWKTSGSIPILITPSSNLAIKVGIGTDNPNSKLSVGGEGYSTVAIYGEGPIGIYAKTTTPGGYAGYFNGNVRVQEELEARRLDFIATGESIPCNSVNNGLLYVDGNNNLKFCKNNDWYGFDMTKQFVIE